VIDDDALFVDDAGDDAGGDDAGDDAGEENIADDRYVPARRAPRPVLATVQGMSAFDLEDELTKAPADGALFNDAADGDDAEVDPESGGGVNYADTNAGMKPQTLRMAGSGPARTALFQLPTSGAPRGVLVITPGCARLNRGFWPYDAKSCPDCLGMSEDLSHTKQGLRMGYAVIVMAPRNTKTWCWKTAEDLPDVLQTLDRFVKAHGLAGKPVVTLGASSGGGTAMGLAGYAQSVGATWLRVAGVVMEVSTNQFVLDDSGRLRMKPPVPPVVWIVMEHNPEEKERADDKARRLRPYAPTAVAQSRKRRVGDWFFSDMIPGVTPRQSSALVGALRRAGMLDASGMLAKNPQKERRWVSAMRAAVPETRVKRPPLTLESSRVSPIWQAMGVAYSNHEHTANFTGAALAWFETGGKASFDDMVARWEVRVPAALTIERVA
jgi:hypothetical protein